MENSQGHFGFSRHDDFGGSDWSSRLSSRRPSWWLGDVLCSWQLAHCSLPHRRVAIQPHQLAAGLRLVQDQHLWALEGEVQVWKAPAYMDFHKMYLLVSFHLAQLQHSWTPTGAWRATSSRTCHVQKADPLHPGHHRGRSFGWIVLGMASKMLWLARAHDTSSSRSTSKAWQALAFCTSWWLPIWT